MSGDPMATPYEIIVDAHVKKPSGVPPPIDHSLVPPPPHPRTSSVIADDSHPKQHVFDVQPTHVQLIRRRRTTASIDIFNYVAKTSTFSVLCPFKHLRVAPNQGVIPPNGKCTVDISLTSSSQVQAVAWCGLLTVVVNGAVTREISVVVDDNDDKMAATQMASRQDALPSSSSSIQEMAMSYLAESTTSTTTTSRSKSRKKGLFFQAKSIEFGAVRVQTGQSQPVRICNGGKESITVFLQRLESPFSCSYASVSLRPRSYVEVPVTFTPSLPGQEVSATMVAYSAADKATVVLQGRGVIE
ncbi:hypothetical protein DYB37_008762 [Aphanomyces astaci]|uniref:Uncharacterized protein n=1 Tax=Aphanomyces astaci TaxID=112090 RepID=A0A418EMP5_APHAT|nr:hypothetical protein DYB35_007333 [Aphanomyces astaci]RHZ15730.1 hypothetical protein DYB37_008762 [Aphanomyces astaci]